MGPYNTREGSQMRTCEWRKGGPGRQPSFPLPINCPLDGIWGRRDAKGQAANEPWCSQKGCQGNGVAGATDQPLSRCNAVVANSVKIRLLIIMQKGDKFLHGQHKAKHTHTPRHSLVQGTLVRCCYSTTSARRTQSW